MGIFNVARKKPLCEGQIFWKIVRGDIYIYSFRVFRSPGEGVGGYPPIFNESSFPKQKQALRKIQECNFFPLTLIAFQLPVKKKKPLNLGFSQPYLFSTEKPQSNDLRLSSTSALQSALQFGCHLIRYTHYWLKSGSVLSIIQFPAPDVIISLHHHVSSSITVKKKPCGKSHKAMF